MLKKDVVEGVINGTVLFENLSKELRGDKEVVMEVVKSSGSELQFASEELRGDREVVLAAVKNSGWALEYVSDELRGDKKVVMEAVGNRGLAYSYCVEKMQRDPDVINLATENLQRYKLSVENYLCEELKELKKKYNVDTLEMALEMEAADLECARLLSRNVVQADALASIGKRI